MKHFIMIIFLFFIVIVPLFCFSQTEYIGRTQIEYLNWGGTRYRWVDLFKTSNVDIVPGPMGRLDLRLSENAAQRGPETDFLLNFDRVEIGRIYEDFEGYSFGNIDIFPLQEIKKFGTGSAGFIHYNHRIEIMPGEKSLFFIEERLPDFTIDFYLYPVMVHDNPEILLWYAPLVPLEGAFTGIRCYINEGKLTWEFKKIFQKKSGEYLDVVLEEVEKTPSHQWTHHAIHFDSDTGKMTLYRNGRLNNIRWITEDGTEDGAVVGGKVSPYLSVPMILGSKFLGYIDEFRISRGKPDFPLGFYKEYGVVLSNVIELPGRGTRLVKVYWESKEDNGTALRVSCRLSELYFPAGEEYINNPNVPRWIKVKNGQEVDRSIPGGRYLQWKVELYGTSGIYTPILHTLTIAVEPDPPPSAPVLLDVEPLNEGVRLSWVKNREKDVNAYRVYYGISSGYYFGKGSAMGDSPITVGDVDTLVLKGLQNERVYFFSITAVDNGGHESGFSKELIARPSSIYED